MIMYLIDFLIEGLCGADQEIDYYLMECVIEGLCVADQETDHVFDGWYDWLIEGLCVVDQETDHVFDGLWWFEGLCVADQEIIMSVITAWLVDGKIDDLFHWLMGGSFDWLSYLWLIYCLLNR